MIYQYVPKVRRPGLSRLLRHEHLRRQSGFPASRSWYRQRNVDQATKGRLMDSEHDSDFRTMMRTIQFGVSAMACAALR